MDREKSFRNFDESHHRVLAVLFHKSKYDWVHGIVTAFFSPAFNRVGTTHAGSLHNMYGKKLLKDGYCKVMLDERHRLRSVKLLRDDNGVSWAPDPLQMH